MKFPPIKEIPCDCDDGPCGWVHRRYMTNEEIAEMYGCTEIPCPWPHTGEVD